MNTFISINPSEINTLTNSIEQAEIGENLVTFSMEDFMAYTPSK